MSIGDNPGNSSLMKSTELVLDRSYPSSQERSGQISPPENHS